MKTDTLSDTEIEAELASRGWTNRHFRLEALETMGRSKFLRRLHDLCDFEKHIVMARGFPDTAKKQLISRWSSCYMRIDPCSIRATVLPFEARLLLTNIHGAILLYPYDENFCYRNDGVWFWHEKYGAVECESRFDDYGSVPLYFTASMFGLAHYKDLVEHNNIVNFDLRAGIEVQTLPDRSALITVEGFKIHVIPDVDEKYVKDHIKDDHYLVVDLEDELPDGTPSGFLY